MEHVVFFPAPDGTPAFRRFAGLDDAVRFVEHLRNVENVSSASVYSLTEVPLSFKAWYRVELPGESAEQLGGPATIAEAIESYSLAEAPSLPSAEVPDQGSATGIVVPDQPFVAVDQFSMPVPNVTPASDQPLSAPAGSTPDNGAQVLEPAFGVKRERGIGFFAR